MIKAPMEPLLIEDDNLSRAWGRAFLHMLDNPGTEISPLVVSISGFDADNQAIESADIRAALDAVFTEMGNWDVETVAFTIFPQRYWKLASGDRKRLFALYKDAFPRLQAMNRQDNRRGLYFERLTMYGPSPCDGNQLEWILSQYKPGVIRSKFQATTFDPCRDQLSSARLGFPCLQHVTFIPTGAGLVVNAFYATQQLFDKAYGNYLGLVQLGAFMAHEMSMPLARVHAYVGVAQKGTINKTSEKLRELVSVLRRGVGSASLPKGSADHAIALTS